MKIPAGQLLGNEMSKSFTVHLLFSLLSVFIQNKNWLLLDSRIKGPVNKPKPQEIEELESPPLN
ncbi:hypothetical protein SAMN05877753_102620 [Bacillus oleivorans]|uniref:Uncharacterized protein n=1 Tax=Bacillus oleivorans TaxID=1448271 RepID=A0A285CM47_9BACI|nr:hypothetical protein SAMN05877753_102620 [Bacillus oleivorans]